MAKMSRKIAATLEEIDARIEKDKILSADDKARIKQRAREEVEKQLEARKATIKEAVEAEYFERALRDMEKEAGLHGAYVDVTVDLAENAAYIAIDGVRYYHGFTYELPYNTAASMLDIMARTWEHENETNGRRRRADNGRRPRNVSMSLSNANSLVAAAQRSLNTSLPSV